jgi:DNA-binding NarL/FixJ family response regulator
MRVVIASDIALYREGLADSLTGREAFEVVGLAASADQAWGRVESEEPDVLLLDHAMPSAMPLTARVFDASLDCRVVVMGLAEAEREILEWARLGIAAFLTCESQLDDLVATLRQVVEGRWLAPPGTMAIFFRHLAGAARGERMGAGSDPLTHREHQVAQLIARGCSNKEIARELGIRVATVKNHVHAVLQKLDCSRRGQAAARIRSASIRRRSRLGRGSRVS